MMRLLLAFGLILTAGRSDFAADVFSNPTAADVPELIRHLSDPNLREGASRALVSLKNQSVGGLVEALQSNSIEVRIWAIFTLGRIGHSASSAVTPLATALRNAEDAQERSMAARSLGQIATAKDADTTTTVLALRAGLSDSDERVRRFSVWSAGRLGSDAGILSPELVRLLHDETLREDVLDAVVKVGSAAVPSLSEALNENRIRLEAAAALREIEPVAARQAGVERLTVDDLPALRIALLNRKRSRKLRLAAARHLGELGVDAAPILIESFSVENEDVARAVTSAFRRIGPEAVPLLVAQAKSDSAIVRARMLDALGAVGPDAKEAVPTVIAALADPDRDVQHRAVKALDALDESAADALPQLIGVMQNPRVLEPTRQLAVKVLGDLAEGDRRAEVVAALEVSAKDSNFGVSSLARIYLKTLKAKDEPNR